MKTELWLLALIFAMAVPGTLLAQAGRRAAPPPKTADKCLLKENINADIAAQVAKFKLVSMPFSVHGLTDSERKMVYGILSFTAFFFVGLMALTIWSYHDFPPLTILH